MAATRNHFVYINEEAVVALLNWEIVYSAVEDALASVTTSRAVQNPRSFTRILGGAQGVLLTMPGCLDSPKFGALACKLVTCCPQNPSLPQPLDSILANIALFSEQTGELKALVAGTAITQWRTAAASVVATKYLTQGRSPQILAILGAGKQGHIHALAFRHFFQFQEVRIWNRNYEKARTLAAELNQSQSGIFIAVASNEECVRNADVIVTATFATEPVVVLEWVKEGAHINAVGAGVSHHSELSTSIYLASDVYVDHVEGAKAELAGLGALGVEFKGAIGSVISGQLGAARPDRISVFQSLGMAVEDCAVARAIYDLYMESEKNQ